MLLSNKSKECIVCHYWHFHPGFKFQSSVCNGCHNFMMLSLSLSDIAFMTVKGFYYRCIIHGVSKSEATHMLKISVLDDRGYI